MIKNLFDERALFQDPLLASKNLFLPVQLSHLIYSLDTSAILHLMDYRYIFSCKCIIVSITLGIYNE